MFHEGDYLFKRGDYADTFFIIISGSVDLLIYNQQIKKIKDELAQLLKTIQKADSEISELHKLPNQTMQN